MAKKDRARDLAIGLIVAGSFMAAILSGSARRLKEVANTKPKDPGP